tara:strand:+ start:249531 stop:250418 length:888 start_codon:yes stop_codon:yes gene_type:complete
MSETKDEPWTVLRLLEWTTNFFKKRDSDSPRLDAEILLAHARECPRIALYTSFADIPEEEQLVAFREMVRRRGEGTPVAQLVGYREFYSMRFRVDENVLIPRPETEHVVIEAIDVAKEMNVTDRPLRIADVGTGSGAIAVTLAKHIAGAELTAVDISADALTIARWNADQHKVTESIQFLESDLLTSVDADVKFDIICSNPPYVSEAEYDELPASVRNYEPRNALVSGFQGTETIERLLQIAPERLVAGGRIVIELSPMIAERCLEIAEEIDELVDAKLIKDLNGLQRVLSVGRT